jgi:hypothetical protein
MTNLSLHDLPPLVRQEYERLQAKRLAKLSFPESLQWLEDAKCLIAQSRPAGDAIRAALTAPPSNQTAHDNHPAGE